MQSSKLITPFWLCSWSIALAFGWLIPNHYMPWTSYHIEIWTAGIILLISLAIIFRSTEKIHVYTSTWLIVFLALIPGVQYAFGMIALAGTAWLSTAYLLAFLLAILIGSHWERATPGQVGDALFLSFGVAAIFSVGIQLYQWLELGSPDDLWIMKNSLGRPFGNLGQPNELGALLVWGFIAIGWGYCRKHLGFWSSTVVSLYLLFGLALTQSRTGWMAVAILVVASWTWRRFWPNRQLPILCTLLGLYFVLCVLSQRWIIEWFLSALPASAFDPERFSAGQRPLLWRIFIDALLQKPFFGYGWNQNVQALLSAVLNHPPLNSVANQSHNIFLDLMIWCGIPIGLVVSCYWIKWFGHQLKCVKHQENALLVLALLVVGNHAMLELPLHHGFFLLPTGLIIGVLSVRHKKDVVYQASRWMLFVLWLICAVFLFVFIRDYYRIENSYLAVRLEKAKIQMEAPSKVPDVLFLTQWTEFIRMAKVEPSQGIDKFKINEMRKVVENFAQAGQIFIFAKVLALNDEPKEAQLWLRKVCTIDDPDLCQAFKQEWKAQEVQQLAPWPEE